METPRLLANLFASLEDTQKDLADKTASDGRYAAYADAMRRVYAQRAHIKSRFLAELDKGCEALERSGAVVNVGGTARAAAELGPNRADEREESLVLNNLVSKAENRYSTQLEILRNRLSACLGADVGEVPLGPRAICGAFRVALKPLYGLDLSTKLVVYKLFDKQVMDGLEGLYARCLECADSAAPDHGTRYHGASDQVSTELRNAVPPPVARLRRGRPREPTGEAGSPVGFDDLRRLLLRRRRSGNAAPAGSTMPTRDLLALLFDVEQEMGPSASVGDQMDLLRLRLDDELRRRSDVAGGCALAAADEDTLDLVSLLFENILQGHDLPDAIKALFARLQIPIITTALADKSFFDDKDHPARRFLNQLARSAVGWVDDGDRGPASLFDRIERPVVHVLQNYRRDPNIFTKLNATVARLLAQEQAQALTAEERARQEIEGRERRQGAESVVRDLIQGRLNAGGEVPAVVSSLVDEGWERVMLGAYRDGGTTGERWCRALAVLDRLLWSVQPKRGDDDRRELLRGIPELLRTLRESLAEVGYDQRRLAGKFRELQALHIAAIRRTDGGSGAPPTIVPVMRQEGSARGLDVKGRPPGTAAAYRKPLGSRPAVLGLRVGSWIQVRHDGRLMRAKLAWRSPESGIHLFVDRGGHKALELNDEELVRLFARGMATIVGDADAPLVDHAVESLVQTLANA